MRLLALKTLLSAKLAEGKIRIVDDESLTNHKTNELYKIICNIEENARILIIHGY